MPKEFIYIKEEVTPEGRKLSAFSTLMQLLKSESKKHLYQSIRYVIIRKNSFQMGSVNIYKVKLNHQEHGKSRTN